MSRDRRYPDGAVRAVLETGLVTPQTAAALCRRLDPVQPASGLDAHALAALAAVCDRLIPQADRSTPIDLAARVHTAVFDGSGDGWRYAALSADGISLAAGLSALDASARTLAGRPFIDLAVDEQEALLRAVQRAEGPGEAWAGVDARRWFEELLAAAVEAYYAHPFAQEEIGYLGMADAEGWSEVGFGARAPFEPIEAENPIEAEVFSGAKA